MNARQRLNESKLGRLVNDSYLGRRVQAFSNSLSVKPTEKDTGLQKLLWGSIRNCDQVLLNLQDEIFRITNEAVSAIQAGKMTPALVQVYQLQMDGTMEYSKAIIDERSRYYQMLMGK